MYDDLTGLHVGDKIYTKERFSNQILIVPIVGETSKAWVVMFDEVKRHVRKKDGYLVGSDTGGRCPSSTYYQALTPEIARARTLQVLRRSISGLGTAKVQVTAESYAELKAAVDTIYRHVTPDPEKR